MSESSKEQLMLPAPVPVGGPVPPAEVVPVSVPLPTPSPTPVPVLVPVSVPFEVPVSVPFKVPVSVPVSVPFKVPVSVLVPVFSPISDSWSGADRCRKHKVLPSPFPPLFPLKSQPS